LGQVSANIPPMTRSTIISSSKVNPERVDFRDIVFTTETVLFAGADEILFVIVHAGL
jgi:hypothetical protein